jgi:ATP-binding cassette, subfamily B, bacterial
LVQKSRSGQCDVDSLIATGTKTRAGHILLLDEATSHLDAITEKQIIQSIDKIGCTRIVIAQRLETVRDADLIIVLDSGRIVEMNSHEELLKAGGKYAVLFAHQHSRGSQL